ncbi:regulatory protein RecX [Roseibium suaedae]|uniref:regulatory protein RecX n=1 Tax=Roseibium suaedae TaxID=735517 RepID=UPI001F285CC4|nr:regulatory protein RecX [Roseibium suaedae]
MTRSAIHYLDRYGSSSENLRRVLTRKVDRAARFHDKDPAEFAGLIDAVVDKCIRSGMVDDQAFAEAKLAADRRRGRSHRQIAMRLRSKGVNAGTVAEVLAGDEMSDLSAARIAARKKRIGAWRPETKRKDNRDRDLAALCRAGFSYQIARAVIDEDQDQNGDDQEI